jgi:hypothetical protein
MIDGTSNMQRTNVAYNPPPGVVDEVKVSTASFDAQYGFNAGAAVNISLKSGTNRVHGQLDYFIQNYALNADRFFRLPTGKPQTRVHRWDIALGGPVVLPKLYDGHNKTFFMYGYEGMWSWDPTPFEVYSVPTAEQKTGDFSSLLAIGPSYQIYDPYSIATAPNGRTSRQPLAGNRVPASLINPISRKIAALWDAPNQVGTVDGTNNYIVGSNFLDHFWDHIFRIDHNLSSKHRFYVRMHITENNRPERNKHHDAVGDFFYRYNRGASFDDVYVVSPTFIINGRYTLTRFIYGYTPFQTGWDLAGLGFSSNFINQIKAVDPKYVRLPNIAVSGIAPLSDETLDRRHNNIHEFATNLTKLAGPHSLRFGAAYRAYQENSFDQGHSSGSFSFSTNWTRGPLDNSTSARMGQEMASFLYGLPTGGSFPITNTLAEQSKRWALYFQDDWKVNRKLTLSLGMRWELSTPLTERYNRSIRNFDPTAVQPIQAQVQANYAAKPIAEIPVGQFKVLGGITFAGVGGNPRTLWKTRTKDFMPRFGFAYSITPKTVFRGGYGIHYAPLGVSQVHVNQTGFSRSTSYVGSIDNGLTFIAPFANPFPDGFLQPYGAGLGIETNLGSSLSPFSEQLTNPYMQRWQFALQRQLPGNSLIEVSYVGNRGTRERVSVNLNPTPRQYYSTLPYRDQTTINFLSAQVSNPFYPLLPGTSLSSTTVARSQLLKPFPEFSGVSTSMNAGYDWYHSLQVRAERRLKSGLSGTLSYTWSKMMEATSYLNDGDRRPEEVIASNDRTHRLVVIMMYELPFGKSRRWDSPSNKVLSTMISGWQLQGIYTGQSGAALGFGNMIFYGNIKNIPLPEGQRTVERWFNTDAGFERDTAKQLGSNIRTAPSRFSGIRADGQNNFDFGLLKNTQIREKVQLQFRAEATNALNHPQFLAPNTTVTSTAFGTITGEWSWPRTGQFGLKLIF